MTLRSDALAWPWESSSCCFTGCVPGWTPHWRALCMAGQEGAAVTAAGGARWTCPYRCPWGQCVAFPPSRVPLGNAALAAFLSPYSGVCCGVWESSPGLWDGCWCLGMAGVSGGAGTIPVPQHELLLSLRTGQSHPLGSTAVLTHHHCSSFFLAMCFRSNQRKPCSFAQLGARSRSSPSCRYPAAAAAVAVHDAAVRGPKATGPHRKKYQLSTEHPPRRCLFSLRPHTRV